MALDVGLDHLEKITEAVTGVASDDLAPTRRKMSQRLYEDLPRVLTHGTAHAYRWLTAAKCRRTCTILH